MEVKTERDDGALILVVEGRIDSSTVSEFQHATESAITDNDTAVLVSLEKLSYINSTGLRAVLLIAKDLWERDARFALYAPAEPIHQVFAIAGFDKIIQICETRAEALAAARG